MDATVLVRIRRAMRIAGLPRSNETDLPASPLRIAGQAALTIGALGVVFGDIGTSPLYTLNETIGNLPPVARADGIIASLSLMFWSLAFAVSFKYIGFITHADNRGEGGIFALLALSHTAVESSSRRARAYTLLLLFGAALLYGDGVITPAISVLGAAEGLLALDAAFEPYVPALTAVILAVLFLVQHRGSRALGRAFGPVMALWFATIAILGAWHIAHTPAVFRALNPLVGIRMLWEHPGYASAILGSVTLAITGTEALYADMGHFGRRAIACAWYGAAFPGLILSYFGQGAYALAHPDEKTNPFFAQAPDGAMRWLLIALSTAAAIIASQALISGTYSLTRQAIQLGFFPRLEVRHTNPEQVGQIYLPLVNATLAILSIGVVFAFGSVARLATAYGIAVTGTMVITTLAFYRVARVRWNWSRAKALPLCGAFLLFDAAFFISNIHKFPDGGWLPFLMGGLLLAVMYTWRTGRAEVHRRVYRNNVTEGELRSIARSKHLTRVEGCAVFMMGSPTGAPVALLHHVKSNRSLQHTVILLSLMTEQVPSVLESERLNVTELGEGLWRVIGHYGYMESPDASAVLVAAHKRGVPINPDSATFYFNREMILGGGESGMWNWQKALYAFLTRNARPAKDYFNIPPSQIIEIGLPVQL
jgi:KUP system potassium uptake protein